MFNHITTVSIHTPTQGVTHNKLSDKQAREVSIHTPTQGVTNEVVNTNLDTQVSIHTPTQGVTASMAQARASMMFQSTHPRRV